VSVRLYSLLSNDYKLDGGAMFGNAPKALWDKCLPGSMGGTYGGNAVACAAGVATIAAMREDGMLANAARQGEKLLKFWKDKQAQYPAIGEARGKGLMLAIECVQPGTKEPNAAVAKAFMAECQKHKVILMGACAMGNGVRFLPPLSISDAEMDIAMGVFDQAAKVVFA